VFVKGAWHIRDDQDALSSMGNTEGGARRGFGFQARILGSNADWLQVDDAHDMDDSADTVKAACDHYDGNISSRMNDPRTGIRTAIMQRCAVGDFSAHVIGHGWFHLCMPMQFERRPACKCPQCGLREEGIPNAFGWVDWRTEPGEVLHQRYTPEYLAERLKVLRHRGFAGQMQQRPAPAGGAMVKSKDLRFWRREGDPHVAARPEECYLGPARLRPTKFDAIVIAGDLAGGKLTTKGDFNALVVIGRSGADFYILEFWVRRAGFPEVQTKVRELARRYPRAKKIIESAASGISLVATLEREISGLVGQTAKGDKESRLEAVLAFFEAGNVFFPDGAPGLDELIASLTTFPNAPHDDDVDAISLALDALSVTLAEEWPEERAKRDRAEAIARGEAVPEPPPMAAKLNALWLGTPIPGKPRDVVTKQVVTACAHEWVDGRCRLCSN
jgi:predicted phage terminase large subunit-like protein